MDKIRWIYPDKSGWILSRWINPCQPWLSLTLILGLELSGGGTGSNVLMREPDVVSNQGLGLLEGDVHRLPDRAGLAVSAAGAHGAE